MRDEKGGGRVPLVFADQRFTLTALLGNNNYTMFHYNYNLHVNVQCTGFKCIQVIYVKH